MRHLAFLVTFALLVSPAGADTGWYGPCTESEREAIRREGVDDREMCDGAPHPSFKLTLGVPTDNPLAVGTGDGPLGYRFRGTREGMDLFRQSFLRNPFTATFFGEPTIGQWTGPLGIARGVGESVRFRPGDGYVITAGADVTVENRSLPFSAGLEFRPVGPVWFRLDWQRSRESVIVHREFLEFIRVEDVVQPFPIFDFSGRLHPLWEVELSRHRTQLTNERKIRADRLGVTMKMDILHGNHYFTLAPEAGGNVVLIRHRRWEQFKEFDYDRFLPEDRGQDPASVRHEVRSSDQATVQYSTTLLWHAGVSGEVYPWGKENCLGFGVTGRYYGDTAGVNFRQVQYFADPDNFTLRTRDWDVTFSLILAF